MAEGYARRRSYETLFSKDRLRDGAIYVWQKRTRQALYPANVDLSRTVDRVDRYVHAGAGDRKHRNLDSTAFRPVLLDVPRFFKERRKAKAGGRALLRLLP